ncbi:MAG: HlyD family secretion protein [Bacteroidetes bacterium HGW-Bacteroidetes-17]|jgi:HlyD family secretion protein|nr:MAG: HlyD family secretion protein [Bacteroidetes bacterium HGW-Bacteroidetes-17]
MKNKLIIIATLSFLISCATDKDQSDAFGNFEVTEIIISAQANGRLLQLNLEEGQTIVSNNVVGFIDSIGLVLKKEQIEETINTVASKLNNFDAQINVQEQLKLNALKDQVRIEQMFKESAATQKQLDDINGSLKVLDKQILSIRSQRKSVMSEIESLKKQRDQVSENIFNCQIINPINGTVLTKIAEEGEITSFGKPLYKIADLNELQLKVYISGNQLAEAKLGQEVLVLIDDGNDYKQLKGKVSWISSKAEFTPKTIQTKEERVNLVYAMKVNVANDGTLKIGMPGEIRFKTNINQ